LNLSHPGGDDSGVGTFVEHCLVLAEPAVTIADLFRECHPASRVYRIGLGGSCEDLAALIDLVFVEQRCQPAI
jgi:hypothetical protein